MNLLKEKNNKKKYKSESARWIFVCCSTWTFVVRSTLIRIYTQRLWIVCVTSLLYFSSLLYLFITEQKLCVVEFRLRFVKIRVNAATFVSLLLFTKKWSRWKTHSSRTLKVYTSRMKFSTEQFGAVVVVVSDCYFFPHCPPYTSATPQSKCTHIVTKHIESENERQRTRVSARLFSKNLLFLLLCVLHIHSIWFHVHFVYGTLNVPSISFYSMYPIWICWCCVCKRALVLHM